MGNACGYSDLLVPLNQTLNRRQFYPSMLCYEFTSLCSIIKLSSFPAADKFDIFDLRNSSINNEMIIYHLKI